MTLEQLWLYDNELSHPEEVTFRNPTQLHLLVLSNQISFRGLESMESTQPMEMWLYPAICDYIGFSSSKANESLVLCDTPHTLNGEVIVPLTEDELKPLSPMDDPCLNPYREEEETEYSSP